jgi:hypothetical protein
MTDVRDVHSDILENMYGVTPNEKQMSTHRADSIPIRPFAPTPARFVGREKGKEVRVDDVRKRKMKTENKV